LVMYLKKLLLTTPAKSNASEATKHPDILSLQGIHKNGV